MKRVQLIIGCLIAIALIHIALYVYPSSVYGSPNILLFRSLEASKLLIPYMLSWAILIYEAYKLIKEKISKKNQ